MTTVKTYCQDCWREISNTDPCWPHTCSPSDYLTNSNPAYYTVENNG